MSTHEAKELIPLWDSTWGCNACFAIIGTILTLVAAYYVFKLNDNWNKPISQSISRLWTEPLSKMRLSNSKSLNHQRLKKYHIKVVIEQVILVCVCIIGLSAPISFSQGLHSPRDQNIGAAYNVSAYHKMKHLQKIYPILPCQTQLKKRVCQSKSIQKASRYQRADKYRLTKSSASKEYNQLKRAYRKTNQRQVNNTKSLHPVRPRWWNYIWN